MFSSRRWSSGTNPQRSSTPTRPSSSARTVSAPDPLMKTKFKVSEQLGVMLWFPVTLGMLPGAPGVAVEGVGGRWMGKYLGSRQVKRAREAAQRHALLDPTSVPIGHNLSEVKAALEDFQNRQWKVKRRDSKGNESEVVVGNVFGQACERIAQYMGFGEVIVKHAPFMSGQAWGSFRVLLQMAASDYQMSTSLAELIDAYIEASIIYHTYWKLYRNSPAASGKKVIEVLKAFEEDIANFNHAARRYFYTKHAVVRFAKAMLTPFETAFQPICDGIKERADRLDRVVNAATLDEHQRMEVLQWLSTVTYLDLYNSGCQRRAANTCEWLLEREEFLSWKTSQMSSILWVHGKACSGKTVLMSKVVEHFLAQCTKVDDSCPLVGYFYCRHDKPETIEPIAMLATVLKQLISHLPEIPDKVLEIFQYHKYQGQTSSRHKQSDIQAGFVAVLEEICKSRTQPTVFIILDGLDECQPEARSQIIGIFKFLMEKPLAPNHDNTVMLARVKVALFSRYEEDVKLELRLEHSGRLEEIPIQQTDTTADIEAFVTTKVKESSLLTEVLVNDEDIKTRIIKDLVKNANGMFLWVNIQQETICRERDVASIKLHLNNLPSSNDMGASYTRILQEISQEAAGNKQLAQHALGWVLYATRPLSVPELTNVLRFSGVSTKTDNEEIARDVITVCHGLLEIEKQGGDSFLKIIHLSAREYLMSTFGGNGDGTNGAAAPKSPPGSPLFTNIGLDPVTNQTKITEICVNYLCQSQFMVGPWVAEESHACRDEYMTFMEAHPFLEYAAVFWKTHLAKAAMSTDLLRSITKFFKLQSNIGLAFQVYWFRDHTDYFPHGSTPYHIGCYFGITKFLDKSAVRRFLQKDHKGRTPIYWAAMNGHRNVLQELGMIEHGSPEVVANGHSPGSRSRGPLGAMVTEEQLLETLLAAVKGNQIEIVQDLLIEGANPTLDTIHAAAAKGNLRIVQLLHESGSDLGLNAIDKYGDVLIAAVTAGALDVAQYLLAEGVDLNEKSGDGNCALFAAVVAGNREMVQLLLAHGADIGPPADGTEGVIELAGDACDAEMVELLLEEAERRGLNLGVPGSPLIDDANSEKPSTQNGGQPIKNGAGGSAKDDVSPKVNRLARTWIIQMVQGALTGNPDIVRKLVQRAVSICQHLFDKEDARFMEAGLAMIPGLIDEFLQNQNITSALSIIAAEGFPPFLRHMALNSKTQTQIDLRECIKANSAMMMTKLIDAGFGGLFRMLLSDVEKELLGMIASGKLGEAEDQLLGVVHLSEVGTFSIGAASTLGVRGAVKIYCSSISALLQVDRPRALASLNSFLAGISLRGLDPANMGVEKRRLLVLVEMGYCGIANGHQKVLGVMRPKVLDLLRKTKGKGVGEVDGVIVEHLKNVMFGTGLSWKWDDEVPPWWGGYEYFNPYAGRYSYEK